MDSCVEDEWSIRLGRGARATGLGGSYAVELIDDLPSDDCDAEHAKRAAARATVIIAARTSPDLDSLAISAMAVVSEQWLCDPGSKSA